MKYFLLICCSALLWAGCTKYEHVPGQPSTGDWLLTKIYEQLPGKTEYIKEEFIYPAGGDQPWVNLSCAPNYRNGIDTIRRDTFTYDSQRRVSQINSWLSGFPPQRMIKRIHYNANNQMDTLRVYTVSGSNGQQLLSGTHVFVYSGTSVRQYAYYTMNEFPMVDSFRYTYIGNNLAEWRTLNEGQWGGYTLSDVIDYNNYDTCNNVYRYLNMNLYFPVIQDKFRYLYPPFISRNNVRTKVMNYVEQIGSFEWAPIIKTEVYSYEKDSIGLITSARFSEPVSNDYTNLRYQYIPAP
ncbi:hypothetical protein [Chitinophaga rhizophila]|uniref:DKNYY family protein n=1 Tax=Chitinophaga rhizophila TaxID=2866212 RepID=A0ABS7GH83_9BACT|nr:hypothetical protein [Chitinophaga rhizophila]MBW8687055.1 hypothetical protein [Chitinophaga rhizophila]